MSAYHGSIRLLFTDSVQPLRPASLALRLKKTFITVGSSAILGLIPYGIGIVFDMDWLVITAYVLTGLMALQGIWWGFRAYVGKCPYCQKEIGKSSNTEISKKDKQKQIECPHCHEWLMSHKGSVRAYTEADAAAKARQQFHAPVFKQIAWANECAVCGLPVTQRRTVQTRKVNAEMLLVGSISVSSGSLPNVPLCDAHANSMNLMIKDQYPRLVFPDFLAMRRYLVLNQAYHGKVQKVK